MMTIFNDSCMLSKYHIDICNTLLNMPLSCENCLISLSRPKILCKKCSYLNQSQPSCKNCEHLSVICKQLEIYKLCLRKFILKKYSRGSNKYFLQKLRTNYSRFVMLFTLSGISISSKAVKVLCEIFPKPKLLNYVDEMNNEVAILKMFAIYHSSFENNDSLTLFNDLLQGDAEKYGNSILYPVMRFDYNFYNNITSKDLFKLMVAVTSSRFDINNSQEYKLAIEDILNKTEILGFIMDKEDFYKLIDLIAQDSQKLLYLSYFFNIEEYRKMLTEEKIISILMKMFKIKSIKSSCPLKDLRIFNDPDNDHEDQESGLDENFDRNGFFDQFIEMSENNQPKFTKMYRTYQRIIETFLDKFSEFTPNGLVKIICIIFSSQNTDVEKQIIFKDLINMIYSNHKTYAFTVDNVLDIMNLHLRCNNPSYFINKMIRFVFNNIKSGDEIDTIFDCVFNSPNKNALVGIFITLYGTINISEPKLNQLIDYLIEKLLGNTIKFFTGIKIESPLSVSFQKKYIQRMIIHPNLKNFDFLVFVDSKIYEHFSRRELDSFLDFCITHEKFNLLICNFWNI